MYSRSSSGYGTNIPTVTNVGTDPLKIALDNFRTSLLSVPTTMPVILTSKMDAIVSSLGSFITVVNSLSAAAAPPTSQSMNSFISSFNSLDTAFTAYKLVTSSSAFVPASFFTTYDSVRKIVMPGSGSLPPPSPSPRSSPPPTVGSCLPFRTATVKDCWNGTSYVTSLA